MAIVLAVAGGCDQRDQVADSEPLRVQRVSVDHADRVLLNQQITIYFNRPVDPLTVTSDTVCVLDQEGNRVRGRLWSSSRSVTFEPIAPVDRTLTDGSFRVDSDYRLEVSGLPLWNTIRDVQGRHLEKGVQRVFRTVPATPGELGFATPFLPTQAMTHPFALLPQEIQVSATSGRMELHFSAPILPTSLSEHAVKLYLIRPSRSTDVDAASEGEAPGSTDLELLQPDSVRILPEARSPQLEFGSTLEVSYDPRALTGALFMVVLDDGAAGLLDYLGRPLVDSNGPFTVFLSANDQVELLSWGGGRGDDAWSLNATRAPGVLGFREVDDGSLEPLCFVEAEAGSLGVFHPKTSMTLRPGVPFDRGDGVLVASSETGDFHFERIEIDEGVEVRVEAPSPDARICLRSVTDAIIAGRLILNTPLATLDRGSTAESMSFSAVQRRSGCTLIVGGSVDIGSGGAIDHVRARESGSPLSIFAAGRIVVRGHLPAEVVAELGDDTFEGTIESPILVFGSSRFGQNESVATRGLAAKSRDRIAEQWTCWRRVPMHHAGRGPVLVVADGVRRGEVVLEAQSAPAHSVDPSRPDLSDRLRQPVRVDGPLTVTSGEFLRFRVRAVVSPSQGADLPSIRGIRVMSR